MIYTQTYDERKKYAAWDKANGDFLDTAIAEGYLQSLVEDAKIYNAKARQCTEKNRYCFLTINPDTTKISLKVFVKAVQDVMRYKCIKDPKWVFEQRGKEAIDENSYHCHAIFERNDHPSRVIDKINRKFEKYVGNKKCLKFIWMSVEGVNNRITYMSGQKKDGLKQMAAVLDREWRVKNGLQQFYPNDITKPKIQLALRASEINL